MRWKPQGPWKSAETDSAKPSAESTDYPPHRWAILKVSISSTPRWWQSQPTSYGAENCPAKPSQSKETLKIIKWLLFRNNSTTFSNYCAAIKKPNQSGKVLRDDLTKLLNLAALENLYSPRAGLQTQNPTAETSQVTQEWIRPGEFLPLPKELDSSAQNRCCKVGVWSQSRQSFWFFQEQL